MKTGKLTESVLKRSILKQIKTKRKEVVIGAGIGEDCAILSFSGDEYTAVSTDPVTAAIKEPGLYVVHAAANDLAAAGAEPVAILISALLPEGIEESQIREMMKQAQDACEELHIQLSGGHTEITPAVNWPVLTATALGRMKKFSAKEDRKAKSGQDIVVTKWIGMEGTAILAKEKREELSSRFSSSILDEAGKFDRFLSIVPEAAVARESGVCVMHDVTEGGIFGALWEMAEKAGVGLEVDLKQIPIRQETIEICEFFGGNPYELISGGCLLISADDGTGLVRELEKKGIPATIVGKIKEGNDRIILNDDERRFLEPAKQDELYRILSR